MKSTDGGMTWTLIPILPGLYLAHLESVQGTPGMYVGIFMPSMRKVRSTRDVGTVLTTDGGINWTRIGECSEVYPDLSFGSAAAQVGELAPGAQYVEKFSISPGRLIGVCPDSVSYPITNKGKSADTVAIDIANYGTDPLQVTGIVPPDLTSRSFSNLLFHSPSQRSNQLV